MTSNKTTGLVETDNRAANSITHTNNSSDESVSGDSDDSRSGRTSPMVDEENLMDKLKNVPISKLKQIITDQIDLEIRLKHKELTLTEEEIGKCESQMITLRNYYKIPRETSFELEPNDFTLKYYDLLNRSLSVNYESPELAMTQPPTPQTNPEPSEYFGTGHTYRTRSTTSSLRPSSNSFLKSSLLGCLYRRTDGIVVKLTCSDCKRSNFSLAQGFLNHSRIAHSREFTSQDTAALTCGEVLPDGEQDEEGLSSLKCLRDKGLDPNTNLNVNQMYYEGLTNSNSISRINMDKSILPLEKDDTRPIVQESELMKKLIKNGITTDKKGYEELLESYKPNEQEKLNAEDTGTSDEDTIATKSEKPSKLKRRRSRANVLMAKTSSTRSPTPKNENSPGSQTPEEVHEPLPKIKIRLKPEDRNKKRKSK